jgi:signal recognition particle receptor subunit beta
MKITDIVDPFELAKSAIVGIFNAYKAWRGFRLLIFGTTRVGKTTLWQYLQTEKIVDSKAIEKTYEITKIDKFRLKTIRLTGIKVAILATDLPGDKKFRSTWETVLNEVYPHGIIFMLDNVEDTSKDIPEIGYDEKRLLEHQEAFEYLTNLIMSMPEVYKNLQAMGIVVNKSDTFPKTLGYGKILEKAGISTFLNKYNELEKCRSTAFNCSALYGHNVSSMIRWMVQNMAGQHE